MTYIVNGIVWAVIYFVPVCVDLNYVYLANILNVKVCEHGWVFVTLSRKNYWTDLDGIWHRYRL